MKTKYNKFISTMPCIILIFIFAFIFIKKYCANDLFFDLKTGQTILKYGIDFKDHFSFIPNLVYIYHHYLYDIMIYKLFNLGGYSILFIFNLLLYSILGIILFYVNNKISKNKFISLIFTLTTMFLIKGYAISRVQLLTYPLFYLYLYFSEKLYKTGKIQYSMVMIILSIIILNLHMPLWILTIIFLLPYILEIVFSILKNKFPMIFSSLSIKVLIQKPKDVKIFLITFIIIIFSGTISPLKLYPYTFFLKALNNDGYHIIMEMQHTVLINFKYLLIILIIMLLIMMILKTKFSLRILFFNLGITIFSLIAIRNIVYVYLFFPTILLYIIYTNYEFQNYLKLKFNLKIFKNIIINRNIVYTTICLGLMIFYLLCINLIEYKNFDYGEKDNYPYESVKYIKKNLDYKNIRLFNEFNFGSYLEYNDIPVFIDSRAEVYISEFNGGYDIIGDWEKTSTYHLYQKILNKYDINYILIYNRELNDYLKNDNNYRLINNERNVYYLWEKIND